MTGTLVIDENLKFFLPILDKTKEEIDSQDLIIGVIDDESGIACGILRAVALDEGELAIRYIYVDEAFRHKGAGEEMMSFLLDFSEELEVKNIRCFYMKNEDNRYLYNLLDNAGFADESEDLDMYMVNINDFDIDDLELTPDELDVVSLREFPKERRTFLPHPEEGYYDEDLSSVVMIDKNHKGMLLIRPFGNYLELRDLDIIGDKQQYLFRALVYKSLAVYLCHNNIFKL